MASSRGSRLPTRGRSPQKRQVAWTAGPGGSGITSITASGSSIVGSGLESTDLDELTLTRTRGILDIFMDGPGVTDGDGYFGAFGIGIVTEPAFAIGITAVPTPITEISWNGWLWHTFFSVHDGDVSLAPNDGVRQRFMIDGKAQRKLGQDEVLMGVIEVVEIGAATLNVFFDTRVLWKLS